MHIARCSSHCRRSSSHTRALNAVSSKYQIRKNKSALGSSSPRLSSKYMLDNYKLFLRLVTCPFCIKYINIILKILRFFALIRFVTIAHARGKSENIDVPVKKRDANLVILCAMDRAWWTASRRC